MNKQAILTLATLGAATAATAALDINLPGNSTQSVWSDMNSSTLTVGEGYNNFGTNTAGWSTPVSPNSGTATFDKVAGTGGYPGTDSIYNFDTPGSFFITENSPLANLETVVFQSDAVGGMMVAPTLSYNGGSQALAAINTFVVGGDFSGMGSNSTIFGYQWDLSGIVDPISDFTINWTSVVHNGNYEMQLNQGDTFQVVPEPSTYALMAGIACGALILMRRQRR
ncbi:PEP-CTERM sorting domain-containing protein [Cerasicoccus fimbriatus]|uniref:PEP-CTERM sorting domain-containing protein n=1 Tax=Cerasicoccus fimbriatus TaxID=3014554 RepID=UPI0022B42966|nr:PEP-CTERM sorting domain-containing protein [Cerasicoccus sp. TK19100]